MAIHVPPENLDRLAQKFGCKVGCWPAVFVGLPVVGNPSNTRFWQPVMENLLHKLHNWKFPLFPRDVGITSLMSTLSSMPTYFFSLYKMPTTIVNSVKKFSQDFSGRVYWDMEVCIMLNGMLHKFPPIGEGWWCWALAI